MLIDIQSMFKDIIETPQQRRAAMQAQGEQQAQTAVGSLSGAGRLLAPLIAQLARQQPERSEALQRGLGGMLNAIPGVERETRTPSQQLQGALAGMDITTQEGVTKASATLRNLGYADKALELEQGFAAQQSAQEESAFKRSATQQGLEIQEAAERRQQTQADAAQRLAQATAQRTEKEKRDAVEANLAVVNSATGITETQRTSLQTIATRSPVTPSQLATLVENYGGTLGKVTSADNVTNYNALIEGEEGMVSEKANGELFVTEQDDSGVFVERRINPQDVVLKGLASSGASQEAINARVRLVQGSNIPRQSDINLLTALVENDNTLSIPELNSMIKEMGGTGSTAADGAFGTSVTGTSLNAFVTLPGPIMDGTASQQDEDTFITAVTDYQQPSTTLDNLGNRVTIQKQIPPHAQAAYNELMRRRAAPSSAAAAAAPVKPEDSLMSIRERAQVFMEGGDVPAVPGQMAINILSGNVTGPINALSRTLALVPGQPFGTFNEPVNAKGFHDLLSQRVLRVFQESPRFVEGERKDIQALIDTANRFWDDPQRLIGAMIGIDQALSEVERSYEAVLKGESDLVPRESYEQAAAALTSIKAYREFALPPRFTNNSADLRRAEEFIQSSPPGTMMLTQNRRGQWQIREVQ